MLNQPNKENKIEQRTKRPTTLAGAIGGLLQMFGRHASDSDLSLRWKEIMGPDISGISQVVAIKKLRDNKFNIILRPSNPAFTLQLSYMTDEIKNKANKYFGYDAIAKVSFRK